MNRFIIYGSLVLAGLVPGRADTPDTPGAPTTRSLAYCIECGLKQADTAGLLTTKLRMAEAELEAARARRTPHLNVTPSVRFQADNQETAAEVRADLGEHFLEIPQNIVRQRVAAGGVTQAEHHRDRNRCLYAARIIRSYVEYGNAERGYALARDLATASREAASAWQTITGTERALAETKRSAAQEAAACETDAEQAGLLRDHTRRLLSQLCGFTNQVDWALAPLPRYTLPPVSLKACLAWAKTHRTDLTALELQRDQIDQLITLAKLGRLPRPHLSFGYNREDDSEDLDEQTEGAFARLALDIPLWDGGTIKAEVLRLQAERDALAQSLDARRSRLTKEVHDAYAALQRAVRDYEKASQDTAAERAFIRAQTAHAQKALAPRDFTRAQLAYRAHQETLQRAKAACYAAESILLEAIQADYAEWRSGCRDST